MLRILITGTNRGIGLELCRQLSEQGHEIWATCRQSSPELQKLNVKVFQGVDVTSEASLKKFSEQIAGEKIDILVNNAGILIADHVGELDFDKISQQIEINAIGPLKVTQALLSHLHKGSKIIMMTSRMGSIADNGSGAFYGYRMSKAALNMAAVSLAHDLKNQGIAVGIIHPGMVATQMTQYQGIESSEAAKGIIARMNELNLQNSGTFWHAQGEILPW
ncbi:MAG: SDR family oxidoreductase [Deltaproteobacteria bacterium]|nr:SDR family oxidoreductase [Deltaproteobacteria bacterium]